MDNPLPPPEPVLLECGDCLYAHRALPAPATTGPASRVWLVHAPSCPACGSARFGPVAA